MAVVNDSIQFGAGLVTVSQLDPSIGRSPGLITMGFDSTKTAVDEFKPVSSTPAALHDALTLAADEYGLLRVTNPNAVGVALYVSGTPNVLIGSVPPGTSTAPATVLVPVGNGVVIKAGVAAGNYLVGVTIIHASKNT